MASPSRLPSTRRPHGVVGGKSRPLSVIEPGFPVLDPPAPDAETSKSAKRRSLLPQLSRAGSVEYQGERDGGRENEDPEGYQNDGAGELAEESSRQADRKAMPPPSKLSRPLSVRTPGSGQLGRAPSTRSHARTQSKENPAPLARTGIPSNSIEAATALPASQTAGNASRLQRAPSIRQPQPPPKTAGLSRSSSIRATQTQSHSRTSSTTPITSTTHPKRPSVSSVKPSSVNTSLTSEQASLRSPTSPTKTHDSRSGSRSQMPPPPRPTFNTFQQHYSPAKSGLPKPHLPSARQSKPSAASNAEEDTTISFDVAKQQLELLQLSLLHQASTRTLQQYATSGKRKLGRKHANLRKELEFILLAEKQHQRVSNLEALHGWSPDLSYLVENLQILARIHKDLTAVTHPESRYTQLLHTFEDWVMSTETGSSDRQHGFVNALPGQWRESHASVALKVRSLQREMAALPPLPTPSGDKAQPDDMPSSLDLLLVSCRSLTDGILRELDMMSKLERAILAREKARIDNAIEELALENLGGKAVGWTPSWQKAA